MGGGASETGMLGDLDGTAAQAPVKDGFVQTVSQKRTDIVTAAAKAESEVSERVDALARVEADATSTERPADGRAGRHHQGAGRSTPRCRSPSAPAWPSLIAQAVDVGRPHPGRGQGHPEGGPADPAAARLRHRPRPSPSRPRCRRSAIPTSGARSGPNRFDCSGLILWSWGKAGVALAHWTGFQIHQGWPIDMKDLQPGDLIFMWRPGAKRSPPDHVAMYIGNHLIVQAPHAGSFVEVSSMAWWPGARRAAVRLAPLQPAALDIVRGGGAARRTRSAGGAAVEP